MADISISVVYVDERGGLFDESLSVPDNCTIGQAIIQSSFFVRYPNMALDTLNVGVYSLRKHLTDVLHDQDRIEIYRPLLIDPKDRRRLVVDAKRNPKKWRQERRIKNKADSIE